MYPIVFKEIIFINRVFSPNRTYLLGVLTLFPHKKYGLYRVLLALPAPIIKRLTLLSFN